MRFIFWTILEALSIVLISLQFLQNPHFSVIVFFFQGTDFVAISQNDVVFPVLWFIYFIAPLLIFLNAFKQLWQKRVMQIRGFQYSPLLFAIINLELCGIVILAYLFITGIFFGICTHFLSLQKLNTFYDSTVFGLFSLLLVNWLGEFSLSLLQIIISKYNAAIGIIVIFSLLIVTAYTAWRDNPLNSLMLSRVNSKEILSLLIVIFIEVIFYILNFRHGDN